jgi:hypothetical protein
MASGLHKGMYNMKEYVRRKVFIKNYYNSKKYIHEE